MKNPVLTPENIRNYLKDCGWVERGSNPKIGAIYGLFKDGKELGGLILPLNPDFADYKTRLQEIPRILSEVEQRSPYDVYLDIALLGLKNKLKNEAGNTLYEIHHTNDEAAKTYLTGVIDTYNDILESYFDEEKIF